MKDLTFKMFHLGEELFQKGVHEKNEEVLPHLNQQNQARQLMSKKQENGNKTKKKDVKTLLQRKQHQQK